MKILTLNCGSSSLKYRLFDMTDEGLLAEGMVEKIGTPTSRFKQCAGEKSIDRTGHVADHTAAVTMALSGLTDTSAGVLANAGEIAAVGHRVVHGGEEFGKSVVIDDQVKQAIRKNYLLAPLHNPQNMAGIEAGETALPNVPHVAVFDTAFHQTIRERAYLYGIPYEYYEEYGIRRYGFHGTSHRYLLHRVSKILSIPRHTFTGITCHLGNGCSITAIENGKSFDTSMGMTPLEGLIMGTRSGDIDPGVLFHLARSQDLDIAGLDDLLNKKSGLLGLSGISNDIRDISQAAEAGSRRAEVALKVFCYRIRKYIGAYLAVLGRADAIVFSGGIGEHASGLRTRMLSRMLPLGVELDLVRNIDTSTGSERLISTDRSAVKIFVIPTNEELMIAQDTANLLRGTPEVPID
ncbi:MAG: acetate kinase [Planctomycetes bacterium]|nr:acetate kinase [Planctomycetota bacterium]